MSGGWCLSPEVLRREVARFLPDHVLIMLCSLEAQCLSRRSARQDDLEAERGREPQCPPLGRGEGAFRHAFLAPLTERLIKGKACYCTYRFTRKPTFVQVAGNGCWWQRQLQALRMYLPVAPGFQSNRGADPHRFINGRWQVSKQ
jgi:hypothetical protein